MDQAIKKYVFYITFVALGVFFAEVVSTNIPFGLIVFPLYLAYGLLYVIFIDALMRYRVRDFRVWYLFGALVGIITETFVAKVIFYGTEPDAFRIFGIAPWAIAFIILFYHAFFSFMAPAYFGRRVLYMPFPIIPKRWIDYLFFAIPWILFPVGCMKLAAENWSPIFLASLICLSAVILSLWILLLRFVGEIKDVLLTKKERMGVVILAVLANLFFLFKATNEAHGHAPTDIPIIPLIGICVVIVGLFVLVYRAISKDKTEAGAVFFDGRAMNLRLYCAWMIWYISFTTALAVLVKAAAVVNIYLVILGLSGAFIGIVTFLVSVFGLLWACQK